MLSLVIDSDLNEDGAKKSEVRSFLNKKFLLNEKSVMLYLCEAEKDQPFFITERLYHSVRDASLPTTKIFNEGEHCITKITFMKEPLSDDKTVDLIIDRDEELTEQEMEVDNGSYNKRETRRWRAKIVERRINQDHDLFLNPLNYQSWELSDTDYNQFKSAIDAVKLKSDKESISYSAYPKSGEKFFSSLNGVKELHNHKTFCASILEKVEHIECKYEDIEWEVKQKPENKSKKFCSIL